jgi:hypothetical protein
MNQYRSRWSLPVGFAATLPAPRKRLRRYELDTCRVSGGPAAKALEWGDGSDVAERHSARVAKIGRRFSRRLAMVPRFAAAGT